MELRLIIICGLKFVIGKQEGFIVGGAYVDSLKDFPHVVALSTIYHTFSEEEGQTTENNFCGSSILNQKILLTAAHCLDDVVKVTAFSGSVDWKKGKLHRIDRYQRHKQWDPKTIINDIALVRLKKPLSFGETVKRVILMKNPPKAKIAELTGWGVTDVVYYKQSSILKHTKLKLWTLKECRKVLSMAPNGTICGGEKNAKKNFAFYGDSGGGLLVNKNIIIGIVSFGDQKPARSLGVYTDVSYFYDWILVQSRRLECSP
ncbi:trypsin epsilon-like [Cydia pomonella]|uniref:trypsin epsilon-like n=1 Tax=Cydia pomonella TaxID=82600 RepID=UPI002ADDAC6D|nr:trypsin epsilon-like [Cydia pomonella]XP_061707619.1 trypsin epsilon-like [Cydia pomonella]